MNVGIQLLRNCDAVIPLNADAVLEEHYIDGALDVLARYPKLGIVGGLVRRVDELSAAAGSDALPWIDDGSHLDVGPTMKVRILPPAAFATRAPKVNGAAPVIRMEAALSLTLPGSRVRSTRATYRTAKTPI